MSFTFSSCCEGQVPTPGTLDRTEQLPVSPSVSSAPMATGQVRGLPASGPETPYGSKHAPMCTL